MLQLYPAGSGTEREGGRRCADRQPSEARPATARGRQAGRVGPCQTAAGTEAADRARRAGESRRDTRDK